MTLERVISAGKLTNNVQTYVIAGLVDMYKFGGPSIWPRDLTSMSTDSTKIDLVRSLSDGEVAKLAASLLGLLQSPASHTSTISMCTNPQMALNDWVSWVLKRQD